MGVYKRHTIKESDENSNGDGKPCEFTRGNLRIMDKR